MSDFGYKVPGDSTDTPENNVAMAQEVQAITTGPAPFDDPGEPITDPDGNPIDPATVPGDQVPVDTEGDASDRAEALTDPGHIDIEDVPEDVANSTGDVPTEDAPEPNTDPATPDVPIQGGEGAAAPAEPQDG